MTSITMSAFNMETKNLVIPRDGLFYFFITVLVRPFFRFCQCLEVFRSIKRKEGTKEVVNANTRSFKIQSFHPSTKPAYNQIREKE